MFSKSSELGNQQATRMLDRIARKSIDPWLEVPAGILFRWGISANAITVGGFVLGMAGCVAILLEQYGAALLLILANRLADGLDGCVARKRGATDAGGFLDIVLDIIFYGGVPFSFALANPEALPAACFLVYSFMGTGGSFLAYAVIAAKRGTTRNRELPKSFFYSVGLMEGTETIVFFVLFCLFPSAFPLLAWIFGALCWVTVLIRLITGMMVFRDQQVVPAANRERELPVPVDVSTVSRASLSPAPSAGSESN